MSSAAGTDGAPLFLTLKELVLASGSPRRKRLLKELGLTLTVQPADCDETRRAGEGPEPYVRRMAREKAWGAMQRQPSAWVVSADTVVSIDDEVLGKPVSAGEAVQMLMRLSGREHEVRTGYCLGHGESGLVSVGSAMTRVRFISFSEELARAYVRTGEPLDKAGAYGIQGIGGSLVARIAGSYSNVVGLPLAEVIALLQRHGVITTA